MSEILNRDSFLRPREKKIVSVDIPELGGCVYVAAMSEAERATFEASVTNPRDGSPKPGIAATIKRRLVVATACDDKGNKLFTVGDLEALAGVPAAAINRIADVAQALCGMGSKDMDELAGESGTRGG